MDSKGRATLLKRGRRDGFRPFFRSCTKKTAQFLTSWLLFRQSGRFMCLETALFVMFYRLDSLAGNISRRRAGGQAIDTGRAFGRLIHPCIGANLTMRFL